MNNFKYAGVYANSNPNNIMDWVEIINTYFILDNVSIHRTNNIKHIINNIHIFYGIIKF